MWRRRGRRRGGWNGMAKTNGFYTIGLINAEHPNWLKPDDSFSFKICQILKFDQVTKRTIPCPLILKEVYLGQNFYLFII